LSLLKHVLLNFTLNRRRLGNRSLFLWGENTIEHFFTTNINIKGTTLAFLVLIYMVAYFAKRASPDFHFILLCTDTSAIRIFQFG